MGQVHLLLRSVSDGRDGRAADDLRRAAVRSEDGTLLHHSAQQVQLLLRLLQLPHHRHDLIHPPVPPALLPHDPTEEEGPGPRGGLQQSGVSEFRHNLTERKKRNQNNQSQIYTLAEDQIIKQLVFFLAF